MNLREFGDLALFGASPFILFAVHRYGGSEAALAIGMPLLVVLGYLHAKARVRGESA